MLNFKQNLIRLLAMPLFFALSSGLVAQELWESTNGSFKASFISAVTPIPINQIHQWILHIETPEGEPVSDANIVITGGMPLHDHGLPTSPIVTEILGEGNYLIEGMRFHMMGDWEITLNISQGNLSESVIIPLRI